MMPPYDPFAFGMPPEDAVSDDGALLDMASGPEGYVPQLENEFLEENPDLPPSEVDPRGMLKGGAAGVGGAMPAGPHMMPDGSMMGGEVQGGGEQFDEEALQQAILDEGQRANELSEQYQAQAVEQNESDEQERARMNRGGM